jgi:hypothetical protein
MMMAQMTIDHWRNNDWHGNLKYLEKNLPIVHLSTQTDMDCPGIELGIFGEK